MLLPAGADQLAQRFEVREGGLEGDRAGLLSLAPGTAALVADPSVTVNAELLDACGDGLRVVANFAVGFDNVDLDACRQRKVIVTNTPDVLTQATAELALGLTLAASRRMGEAERDLRAGRWTGWDPAAYRGLEVRGSTVGVLGLGRIGGRYAELVHALGAEVLYAGPSEHPEANQRLGARRVDLAELLAASDIVSLHARATVENRHLIGADELRAIGPEGVLVNTGRGTLVDEAALAHALSSGELGAAGLDVFESEPDVHPALLAAPNCVLLPHIGSATRVARDEMARLVAKNVTAALEGREPSNRVA